MTDARRPASRTANRHPQLTNQLRTIISHYAQRVGPNELVMVCQPRDIELRFYPNAGRPEWSGNNGKICYSQLDAHLAAEEINKLPGADLVQAYRCPRGGHYHHVAQDRARRTARSIVHLIAAAARRAR